MGFSTKGKALAAYTKEKPSKTPKKMCIRDSYWDTPESEVIHREELQLLRRELALLSSQYREATVAYYIRNKSCAEIAHDLRISVEMVKYYLFKTRKILKEGVEMTREFGEKSYHPGNFQMDFWGGGDNSRYWALFKRKLRCV